MQGGSKSKPLSKIVITSYQILSVMLVFSSVSSIKWAQEYYKFVLNILCVTYFVTLSATVFEAAIWVKSWLKTRKKEEMWKSKNLYINLYLKYGLGMEFTADTTLIWRRNRIQLAGFNTIFWKFGIVAWWPPCRSRLIFFHICVASP